MRMRISQLRRVLLVGMPAICQSTSQRLIVALTISVFFLVLQHEKKPYLKPEHNFLASLASAQITSTLLLLSMRAAEINLGPFVSFLCIMLNVIAMPIIAFLNLRRLKRRQQVFNALKGHTSKKVQGAVAKSAQKSLAVVEKQDGQQPAMPNPEHFKELWKSGRKTEYVAFCAAFEWLDYKMEFPVTDEDWQEIVCIVEQMPMVDPAYGDVRYGTFGWNTSSEEAAKHTLTHATRHTHTRKCPPHALTRNHTHTHRHVTVHTRAHITTSARVCDTGLQFDTAGMSGQMAHNREALGLSKGDHSWFGTIECADGIDDDTVRAGTFEASLHLISTQMTLPAHRVRVDSVAHTITLLDASSITLPYKVRVDVACAMHFLSLTFGGAAGVMAETCHRQRCGTPPRRWRGSTTVKS